MQTPRSVLGCVALKPLFDQCNHCSFHIKEIDVEYWIIASIIKTKSLYSKDVIGSFLVV